MIAALVGPFLVDWTAYRSTFERYGEQALGHRVEVMGEAEMRLLPTPTLTFTDVRVGEPEDALLVISRFSMRVELPPLLKGEVRVIDMTMDEPTLQLVVDEQGRLDWFTALRRNSLIDDLDPDLVMLEQATIRDGRFIVTDARSGRTHSVEDIDVSVAARSLKGPFRIDGMAAIDGERATVLVSTGRADPQGGIRVRAGITPVATPGRSRRRRRMSIEDGVPPMRGVSRFRPSLPRKKPDVPGPAKGHFRLPIPVSNSAKPVSPMVRRSARFRLTAACPSPSMSPIASI